MSSSATNANWTTRRLLAWMQETFAAKDIDQPRLAAELLLTHVTGQDRLKLYTDPDRPAAPDELDALRGLVKRALTKEPIQYLIGVWSFYGLDLATDSRALIPRPCTETSCDRVLEHFRAVGRQSDDLVIADVCTGSGCLGIALAKNLPAARVILTDVSEDALSLARENTARHDLSDRVELRRGDLLEPLAGEGVDALVANPPYIPDTEWADVDAGVKDHEPELALRGGPDGLALVRPLIEQASEQLKPGGILAIEIAAATAGPALGLLEATGLNNPALLKDREGLNRVVTATR